MLIAQKLNSGEDPITAFVLSSEAALAGAESTKNMQAQVTTYWLFYVKGENFCGLDVSL